jgi:hypothetical protein
MLEKQLSFDGRNGNAITQYIVEMFSIFASILPV